MVRAQASHQLLPVMALLRRDTVVYEFTRMTLCMAVNMHL